MRQRLARLASALFGRTSAAPGEPGERPDLPFPPLELRRIVGPTDKADFDNPSGAFVWGDLALGGLPAGDAYRRIFDFGCGCGRNARQLLLQATPPEKYVGIDVSRKMIRWCRQNLRRPEVEVVFDHHDVWSPTYAPRNSRRNTLAIRHYGCDFTLINAHSVFTHLYERQTEFYLNELRRMIGDDGLLRTTWFFFNRAWFPVLGDSQNTLFVNDHDPTQAVYYDWGYFLGLLRRMDLRIVHVNWTQKPGYQTEVFLTRGSGDDLTGGFAPPGTVLGFGPSQPPPYDGP